MKISVVYLLDYAITEGKERTAQLTSQHEPEILADGWVRFRTADGVRHRVPPTLVRRITEEPETVQVQSLQMPMIVKDSANLESTKLPATGPELGMEPLAESGAAALNPRRPGRPKKS